MTAGHLHVTWGGSYSDAALSGEAWSCGLRLMATPGAAPGFNGTLPTLGDVVYDPQTADDTAYSIESPVRLEGGINDFSIIDFIGQEVRTGVEDWMGQEAITEKAELRWIKVGAVGTDGLLIAPTPFSVGTPAVLTYKTAHYPTGGGDAAVTPLQLSVVASHRSGAPGRKGRGRMFLPALAAGQLNSAGLLIQANAEAVRDAQVALLDALSMPGTNGGVPSGYAVTPAIIGVPGTTYFSIQQVRVGNVVDTQRRRRNQLAETYYSADKDPFQD